jgi:hypothetical protein
MLTIQYANAFRRSGPHAHIKINAATLGYISRQLDPKQPYFRIARHRGGIRRSDFM